MSETSPFIIAIPKGRVYEDFLPLLQKTKFALKDDPKKSRKLLLDTQHSNVKVLVIRGWDIPTYINSGAAHIGIVDQGSNGRRKRFRLERKSPFSAYSRP